MVLTCGLARAGGHFTLQPGPRELPIPHDRFDGHLQCRRRLLDGEATEKPHLHHAALALVQPRERLECIVQCHQFEALRVGQHLVGQRDTNGAGAAFLPAARAREIDEHSSHHRGGHRQEVRTVLPADALDVDEPEIGLVDQRCRVQAVAGPFPAHAAAGDLLQLGVHEGNQAHQGLLVAVAPSQEKAGDAAR